MVKVNGLNIVNCCPHSIDIMDVKGNIHTIPKDEDELIRVSSVMEHGFLAGFNDDVVSAQYIESLPPKKSNTIYIVSNPVLQILKRAKVDRDDFRGLGKKVVTGPNSNYRVGFITL